jgi:hypothetical protein
MDTNPEGPELTVFGNDLYSCPSVVKTQVQWIAPGLVVISDLRRTFSFRKLKRMIPEKK